MDGWLDSMFFTTQFEVDLSNLLIRWLIVKQWLISHPNPSHSCPRQPNIHYHIFLPVYFFVGQCFSPPEHILIMTRGTP